VYDNPTPVVICLQPIWDQRNEREGLAIAKRAIPPHIGGWTLIAGHIENNGENVEQAGAREFREETSVDIGTDIRLVNSYANGKGHLLIVVEAKFILLSEFNMGKPCHENLELDVMWEPRDLAFPIHTDAARKWFEQR
jgi:8-oxo-dGTP pyrophosphatase MutT (NUDIX family)